MDFYARQVALSRYLLTRGLWLLGLAMLYPACRWFGEIKGRRRDWWLGYL